MVNMNHRIQNSDLICSFYCPFSNQSNTSKTDHRWTPARVDETRTFVTVKWFAYIKCKVKLDISPHSLVNGSATELHGFLSWMTLLWRGEF